VTLTGSERFCHLRSYLATAAEHGINLYDALVQLTSGRRWTPTITRPEWLRLRYVPAKIPVPAALAR
jgi:hypothetical protein